MLAVAEAKSLSMAMSLFHIKGTALLQQPAEQMWHLAISILSVDKRLTVSKPYLLHYLNNGYGNIISLPNED